MGCQYNNLFLNVIKTKEMIVDYRKKRTEHATILIDGASVESFKFLDLHTNNKLSWSKHTKTVVKRARNILFPLRRLEKILQESSDPQKVLQLHSREHPDGCITAWYGNCSASDRKALPEPSFLPSRTSIPGGVRARP